MDESSLRNLLERLQSGRIEIDEAVDELRFLPYADLGMAKVDHHRELRSGFAEAIYGPGKTPTQVAAISKELLDHSNGAVLVTRAGPKQFAAVLEIEPEARYYEESKLIVVRRSESDTGAPGVVLVASGGTADQVAAEEAALTLEALGIKVERLRDVGVAGLHRLLAHHESLQRADIVIVVAGMEGALASIVGGLVAAPVIAVPTSVGYGAGAGGITPLLAMLNSCAPGVAVVNIDNGFGAAVFAATILNSLRA